MNFKIRSISIQDLDRIAEIEGSCFPAAEAAPKEAFKERIAAFGEWFFAVELKGSLIGFIDGCSTDSDILFDEMYHDTRHHNPGGKNLAIFGLNVLPDYRKNGIAASLLKHFAAAARDAGKKAILLTCKKQLVHYYEKEGYQCQGLSESTHGGAEWYDMMLPLS